MEPDSFPQGTLWLVPCYFVGESSIMYITCPGLVNTCQANLEAFGELEQPPTLLAPRPCFVEDPETKPMFTPNTRTRRHSPAIAPERQRDHLKNEAQGTNSGFLVPVCGSSPPMFRMFRLSILVDQGGPACPRWRIRTKGCLAGSAQTRLIGRNQTTTSRGSHLFCSFLGSAFSRFLG